MTSCGGGCVVRVRSFLGPSGGMNGFLPLASVVAVDKCREVAY